MKVTAERDRKLTEQPGWGSPDGEKGLTGCARAPNQGRVLPAGQSAPELTQRNASALHSSPSTSTPPRCGAHRTALAAPHPAQAEHPGGTGHHQPPPLPRLGAPQPRLSGAAPLRAGPAPTAAGGGAVRLSSARRETAGAGAASSAGSAAPPRRTHALTHTHTAASCVGPDPAGGAAPLPPSLSPARPPPPRRYRGWGRGERGAPRREAASPRASCRDGQPPPRARRRGRWSGASEPGPPVGGGPSPAGRGPGGERPGSGGRGASRGGGRRRRRLLALLPGEVIAPIVSPRLPPGGARSPARPEEEEGEEEGGPARAPRRVGSGVRPPGTPRLRSRDTGEAPPGAASAARPEPARRVRVPGASLCGGGVVAVGGVGPGVPVPGSPRGAGSALRPACSGSGERESCGWAGGVAALVAFVPSWSLAVSVPASCATSAVCGWMGAVSPLSSRTALFVKGKGQVGKWVSRGGKARSQTARAKYLLIFP